MKRFVTALAATALLAGSAVAVSAGEPAIKPLTATKSTQAAPPSLSGFDSLTGAGVDAGTLMLFGLIITGVVAANNTSGTQ